MSKPIIDCLPTGTILHGEAYEYEIIKALGQGAFGITYLAEVQLRGKLGMVTTKVAIKEFFMHEINGRDRDKTTVTSGNRVGVYDKYKRKFISEARNLSKLSRSKHNHIINVLEAFEANNTVYYSMDYIEDGSLDDLIQKKGCLGVDETLQYTSQIASALSFMHLQNMLHLDVKPSNVMLRNGSAVLIDFGLSKQYNEEGIPESSTTIGAGTPGYAPIEQVNYQESSEEGLPVTMDIYALGATMFKMLTGHTPPTASHILNKGLPLDELKEKGVGEEVVQLVTHCMKPVYEDRYQTVQDFQSDLKRVYSGTPEEETDFDKGKEKSDKKKDNHGQSGRTPQPPLWLKIALFGVVLALIIGGVLYYNNHKHTSDNPVEVYSDTIEVVDVDTIDVSPKPIEPEDPVKPQPEPQPDPIPEEPQPASGSLEITTTPSDVEIYINGKSYGKSPTTIDNLALGSYKVELRKKGYITETKQVNIKYNNQTISLDRSLQEEPKVEPVVEKPRQQNPEIEKLLNNMVYVAGGTFLMGAQDEDPNAPNYDREASVRESPVHSVTVSSFYMSKYEVTQGLWEAVMGTNPSYFKGDNLPVEFVSWDDCQNFIAELNELTGKEFRLPTEAEWEYAARGGNKSRGYKYSGSNTISDVAWYSSSKPHPVGSKQPNELGLYDMSGNVYEWCSDYWRSDYYNSTPSGSDRVLRGGSCHYNARYCRVSDRVSSNPGYRYDDGGCRLVCAKK